MSHDLLTVGEALSVFVPRGGVAFRRADVVHRVTAGAELNVAVAVARLGLRSGFIGRVGQDLAGEAVIDDVRREGVDTSHVTVDPQAPTGVIIREIAPQGARVNYLRSGSAGSRLRPDDLPLGALLDARALHVSGVTLALSESARAASTTAVAHARSAGVATSFDLNYRSKLWSEQDAAPVLREAAQGHRVLIGGCDEMAMVFGSLDPKEVRSITGCDLVVITKSDANVVAADESGDWEGAVRPAPETDVVGAGDAFVGGMLAALLAGRSNREAVQQGIWCGGAVVRQLGDWTGLPWGREGILAPSAAEVLR